MKLSKTDLPSLFLFVCSAFVHSFVRTFVRSFVCLFVHSFVLAILFFRSLNRSFGYSFVCNVQKFLILKRRPLAAKQQKEWLIARSHALTLARTHARTYKHAVDQAHPRTHAQTNERMKRQRLKFHQILEK